MCYTQNAYSHCVNPGEEHLEHLPIHNHAIPTAHHSRRGLLMGMEDAIDEDIIDSESHPYRDSVEEGKMNITIDICLASGNEPEDDHVHLYGKR